MSLSLWNTRQVKGSTVKRPGYRECEHKIDAGAPPLSGSPCGCSAAQLDCTNPQDRDHLGHKCQTNGSLPSYDIPLVPNQSNADGTMSLWAVSAKHCSVGCPSSYGF